VVSEVTAPLASVYKKPVDVTVTSETRLQDRMNELQPRPSQMAPEVAIHFTGVKPVEMVRSEHEPEKKDDGKIPADAGDGIDFDLGGGLQ
jgi:hypothetical protein